MIWNGKTLHNINTQVVLLKLSAHTLVIIFLSQLERLRYNISSALANTRDKHPGMSGQTTQAAQGPLAWFKSLISGEFFDDGYSKRDTDKVESYLDQSYNNLASIIKVSW